MQLLDIKIGFLGFGNMAQAMAKGWLKAGQLSSNQFLASGRRWAKLEQSTRDLGIQAVPSNQDLVEQSDWVILAVKPQQVPELLEEVKEVLKDKVLISIAAGLSFDDLEEMLAEDSQHVTIMPNLPIEVAEGAVSVESRHSLSKASYALFQELFEQVATLTTVSSEQMGVAGVINGCGPAFAAIFIEALADAGVKYGLNRSDAYQLASQTLKGTGQLLLDSQTHPAVIKDAVTSPGGTTIKGVSALEENAFRSAVIQAFDAILDTNKHG